MSDRKGKCVKCGWIGTESERDKIPSEWCRENGIEGHDLVCPKCAHDEFYMDELETGKS